MVLCVVLTAVGRLALRKPGRLWHSALFDAFGRLAAGFATTRRDAGAFVPQLIGNQNGAHEQHVLLAEPAVLFDQLVGLGADMIGQFLEARLFAITAVEAIGTVLDLNGDLSHAGFFRSAARLSRQHAAM